MTYMSRNPVRFQVPRRSIGPWYDIIPSAAIVVLVRVKGMAIPHKVSKGCSRGRWEGEGEAYSAYACGSTPSIQAMGMV